MSDQNRFPTFVPSGANRNEVEIAPSVLRAKSVALGHENRSEAEIAGGKFLSNSRRDEEVGRDQRLRSNAEVGKKIREPAKLLREALNRYYSGPTSPGLKSRHNKAQGK